MSATRLAIEAVGVSKTFRLPHERRTTLKEYFLHPLHRTTYEQQQALDDVSFTVETGEFFGIIGPNGSGKSTLLKILAGIYRQDRGTVRIDGVLSPFIELGVGFNPELTARDNIRINGTLLGLSPRELEERFDEIVEFAELERFVDQKLKNFSSGMQVRLAYSIAIQVDVRHPAARRGARGRGREFQEKCFETFERFRAEGKTIVLVSHDLGSVSDFCDRALFLERGITRGLGPPRKSSQTTLRARSLDAGAGSDAADLEPPPSAIVPCAKRVKRAHVDDHIVFCQSARHSSYRRRTTRIGKSTPIWNARRPPARVETRSRVAGSNTCGKALEGTPNSSYRTIGVIPCHHPTGMTKMRSTGGMFARSTSAA